MARWFAAGFLFAVGMAAGIDTWDRALAWKREHRRRRGLELVA